MNGKAVRTSAKQTRVLRFGMYTDAALPARKDTRNAIEGSHAVPKMGEDLRLHAAACTVVGAYKDELHYSSAGSHCYSPAAGN
jgi:hypothetical protein